MARRRKSNRCPHNSDVKFVNFLPSYAHRSKVTILLFFLTLIAVCGCGVGKPVLISREMALEELRESYASPLAYDVTVKVDVAAREGCENLVDSVELGERVVQVLDGSVFKSARIAAKKGAHSFELSVSDFELKYEGRSGVYVPSLLLWAALTSVGSMFLGDESYSASGQVHAVLESAGGEQVWAADFAAGARCNLSDFQRGWTVWDLYLPGPLMAHPHLDKASRHVGPHFVLDVQTKLLEAVRENPIPRPQTDCAIVVGVSKFPAGANAAVKYTIEDATAIGKLLKRRGGTYLEGTFIELTGEVSASRIRSELEKLGARRDVKLRNVVLYYAGCGQITSGEQGQVHSLLTSSEPITLTEVVEKLSALASDNTAVILDCGFSGKGGRCVPFEGEAPAYPDEVMKSGKVTVLFACGPGQSAYEDSVAGHGLFTGILFSALEQFPGAVNFKLLGPQVDFEVSRRAREGGAQLQEPVCNNADALILPAKAPTGQNRP